MVWEDKKQMYVREVYPETYHTQLSFRMLSPCGAPWHRLAAFQTQPFLLSVTCRVRATAEAQRASYSF